MPDRDAIKFIKTTFTGYLNVPVKDIFGASALVLVAHPDDETVGAGALFRYLDKAVFAHITDGAPKNLVDAVAHGFSSAGEYAEARRKELMTALALAGVSAVDCVQCGIPDQEAAGNLFDITLWVMEKVRELQPETILTLAYEGGHPDHDAVSFAAHAARALLKKEGGHAPHLIEFPLYHAGPNGMQTGFLPREDVEAITFILTEEERRLKREMIETFTTQAGTLRHFLVEEESFRPASAYDFTSAPHEGQLYYESFEWGDDGAGWRRKVKEALLRLGLKNTI